MTILLSTAQAARRTGTPVRTIRWAIANGRLVAQKLGEGAYMIDSDDLDTWVANRASMDGRHRRPTLV